MICNNMYMEAERVSTRDFPSEHGSRGRYGRQVCLRDEEADREVKITVDQPKNHRSTTANVRAICARVMKAGYYGITMLLTTTPETHDGHYEEMFEVYNPLVYLKLFTTDNFLFVQKTGRVTGG
jgi:hypothetical protein